MIDNVFLSTESSLLSTESLDNALLSTEALSSAIVIQSRIQTSTESNDRSNLLQQIPVMTGGSACEKNDTIVQKLYNLLKKCWVQLCTWANTFKKFILKKQCDFVNIIKRIFNGKTKEKANAIIKVIETSTEDTNTIKDNRFIIMNSMSRYVDTYKGSPYINDVTIKCVSTTVNKLLDYNNSFCKFDFIAKIRDIIQWSEKVPSSLLEEIENATVGNYAKNKNDDRSFVGKLSNCATMIESWYKSFSSIKDNKLTKKEVIDLPLIHDCKDLKDAMANVANGNCEKFSAKLNSAVVEVTDFISKVNSLNGCIDIIDRSRDSRLPGKSIEMLNLMSNLYVETCACENMFCNGAMLISQEIVKLSQFINAIVSDDCDVNVS